MHLDAKTTALVLIDLQKGVLAMPVMPHAASAVYEPRLARITSSEAITLQ